LDAFAAVLSDLKKRIEAAGMTPVRQHEEELSNTLTAWYALTRQNA